MNKSSRRFLGRACVWVAVLSLAASALFGATPSSAQSVLAWDALPALPDRVGFAGSFAGADRRALIVGGGANFPDPAPWEGGVKKWHDQLFVLEPGATQWTDAGRLPQAVGYGLSLTTPEGVLMIGGGNAQENFRDVWLARWDGARVKFTPMPALPRPLAMMAGALLGRKVFVAGGVERPDAKLASRAFWMLDLARVDEGWRELEPWPGPERMLANGGAQDGAFFLFGGARLTPTANGGTEREWLRDAWRYTLEAGWRRVADLPHPVAAAPGPALAIGQTHLLLLGGDDGAQIGGAPNEHRGFPRTVLAYHTITDTWTARGEVPFSLVTTPVVPWGERFVIPGGEARPGVRSTAVWASRPGDAVQAEFGWINYAALVGYLAAMVAIGWFCARRNRNTEDYFKGGGRIPWWAAGISIYATMLSSLTFMAIPAKAFASDWTFFWANVPILLIAPIIVRLYLPFFRRLNITSAYEYLELRFNLPVRLYGSLAFILFQIGRQAIVLLLPALALATVSDLDVTLCIVLMGALCVLYTVMGGMEAVIWTDVAQAALLLGAALVSLLLIMLQTPEGLGVALATASDAGKFTMFNWTLDPTTAANAFWVIIIGNLFVNLVPYTSDQAVVQRYLTTSSERKAAHAIWMNAALAIPSTFLFFAIGTALYVFYRANPQKLDPLQATDSIFPSFIVQNLPVGIAGLVIAGIFAAAQSTVSGSLNSVVTAAMTDFYRRFGGRAEARQGLRLARWLTAGVGLFVTACALVLAESNLKSLWDAYNGLVGLAGSGLAGVFALGIFTRRASAFGALVGALASAGVLAYVQTQTTLHFFLYAGIGIVTCFTVGWLASFVRPRQNDIAGLTLYGRAQRIAGDADTLAPAASKAILHD